LALIGFLVAMAVTIWQSESYSESFDFIISGIRLTMYTTLVAFGVALLIGLFVGLGRISHNVVIRNLAITYVEFVRGVPTLVLIFTLAIVIVPTAAQAVGIDNQSISGNTRAIAALAIIYGAFLAEARKSVV